MKVVDPQAREATGGTRTRTLTQTFIALTPSMPELLDALALVALAAVAFVGLANTFDTWQFYFVALLGVLLGIFAAHLAQVLRWHWLTVALLVVVEFLLLGSAVSVRDEALFGALPTLASLQSLFHVSVDGWKEMLTTLPPVDGGGPFVALPYLMGLVFGAVGFGAARERRRPLLALIPPVVLLAGVILLGTLQPPSASLVGLAFAAVAFVWAAWRYRQRRRLVGTGSSDKTQVVFGAGMLVLALAGGLFLGNVAPGAGTQRLVLRTYVQPPIDLGQYASPLVGFRQYSSEGLKRFYDVPLLKVEGAPAGALLRMAVLDDYSGRDWSATAGTGPLGFQRVGSAVPNVSAAGKLTLTVTVQAGYVASVSNLAMWIPSLGDTASVEFLGANAKNHAGAFRFNVANAQGVAIDRLRTNDVVKVVTAPLPTTVGADNAPGGAPILASERYAFVDPAVQRLGGRTGSAWERLNLVAKALQAGQWSDGTLPAEAQYMPGHSERRITDFLAGVSGLVGSDEQYAAALALMANDLGYPARVVMGAVVPASGDIAGKDVSAWVEVQTVGGWVAIPPSSFIPPRTNRPDQVPQPVAQDARATNVPPPNPIRAPGNFDDLADGQLTAAKIENLLTGPSLLGRILGVLLLVGPPVLVVGLVLGGILGAKALRSRRRRTVGVSAHRVASGWRDVLDRARDMGIRVPASATRLEQSRLIGVPAVAALAVDANALILGPVAPDQDAVDDFWAAIRRTKAEMLRGLPLRRRIAARLNPRSFLPDRVSTARVSAVRVRRLPKLALPRRVAGA